MGERLTAIVRLLNTIAQAAEAAEAAAPAASTPPAASPRSTPDAPTLRPARPPYVPPVLVGPGRPLELPEDPMAVLEIDNQVRRCGGKGDNIDLWPIASLPARTHYKFGAPIFAPPQWLANVNAKPLTQEEYNCAILDYCPEIGKILPIEGVVIAGGAAAQPFNRAAGDIDFFFVGVEPGAIWAKVAEVEHAIRTSFFDGAPKRRISFITTMTTGVITIFVDCPLAQDLPARSLKIQLILRPFPSVSYLLHGFDLGSCAIAFDGVTAYTTTLGAFSLLHRVNIVCPSRRSTTYELRLEKYFRRRYAIAMPNLDIKALVPGETLDLPFLRLQVEKVYGLLAVGSILPQPNSQALDPASPQAHASDYEDSDSALAPSWTTQWHWRAAMTMVNSWRLATGRPGFVIRGAAMQNHRGYETNVGIPFADYAQNAPGFDEVLPRQDFIDIVHRVAKKVFSAHRLNVVTLRRFFGLSQEQVNRFAAAVADVALVAAATSDARVTIDTLPALRPFCDALIARYDAAVARDGGKIDWVVLGDPSSQCTVTLNPRIVDPSIWYGAAFSECAEGRSVTDYDDTFLGMIELLKGVAGNSDKSYDNTCAICFSELATGDAANVMTLGCGHSFHWVEEPAICRGLRCWENATCPTCRRPYDRKTGENPPQRPRERPERPQRVISVVVAW